MSTHDPLAFFDGDVSQEAVAAAAEAATATEATTTAATPVTAPDASAEAATGTTEFEGAPSGFVPYPALKEERTKRKTLEDEIATLRKAQDGANRSPTAAAQPAAPVRVPDPGTPEYGQYVQQALFEQQVNTTFGLSEARFIAQHGTEETGKLQKWVEDQDQFFFQRLLASTDPYSLAKTEYDRDSAAKAYKDIPQDELTAFREWKTAQAAANTSATQQPAVVAPSVAKKAAQAAEGLPKPASSGTIVNTPSAGGVKPGETPAAPGTAFDNIFA